MENLSSPEKLTCFIPLIGSDCPDVCQGLLDSSFAEDKNGGEGFLIQVCPNPERRSSINSETDYCGNGPDVIIMYRNTIPTAEEYEVAVKNFGQ